jgi:hypothetical protein
LILLSSASNSYCADKVVAASAAAVTLAKENTNWISTAKTAFSNPKETASSAFNAGWEFTSPKVKYAGKLIADGTRGGVTIVSNHKIATGVTACATAAASIALYVYLNQDKFFDKNTKEDENN